MKSPVQYKLHKTKRFPVKTTPSGPLPCRGRSIQRSGWIFNGVKDAIVTHQHIYFCLCMLHTYDKQYSVTRSSRYGILENFNIRYYNCYSTYCFVLPHSCVALHEGSLWKTNGTNDSKAWKQLCPRKDSVCLFFFCSFGKHVGAFYDVSHRSKETRGNPRFGRRQ